MLERRKLMTPDIDAMTDPFSFAQIKALLCDERTLALGNGRFLRDGILYEIDPLDLQQVRDECLRGLGGFVKEANP